MLVALSDSFFVVTFFYIRIGIRVWVVKKGFSNFYSPYCK
jgi:hypothetical protein